MEKEFIQPNALSNSKDKVESTIIKKDGKSARWEAFKNGPAWHKDKLSKGWEVTPDGIMPLKEIKKAGYIMQDGNWMIPSEVYLTDGNDGGKAGVKNVGPSQQYLYWRKHRHNNDSHTAKQPTTKEFNFKNKEEDSPPVFKDNDDIKIEDIPF